MCLDICFVQCGEDLQLVKTFKTYTSLGREKLFGGMLDTDYLDDLGRVRKFFYSKDAIHIGYKYFSCNTTLYSTYNDDIKLNKWMTSKKNLETTKEKEVYMTGFHILWNRNEARKWKGGRKYAGDLYKVEYKNPHGLGLDRDCQVVLASQMRVIGRVK